MKRRRILLLVSLVLFLCAETALGSGSEYDSNVCAFAALVTLVLAM
jgi:hypothetical protein